MKAIGIDQDLYLVYEGQRGWGQAVWPVPTLLAASIIDESCKELTPAPSELQRAPFIFVDEGYDPVSRVRKGRLFMKPNSPLEEWYLSPHPAVPGEQTKADLRKGLINKQLVTFWEFNWTPILTQLEIERPLVLLGNTNQYTIWSVIAVEASFSGEAIVYLKARKTLGALPRIKYDLIPESSREQVRAKIDYLATEINVAGPESIVDAVREAMTSILSAYAQQAGLAAAGLDLGKLANSLAQAPEQERKGIVINLAKTVALLHSRRKNSEQERRDIRPITEQDAELAIQSVATVVCDIGWAEWV